MFSSNILAYWCHPGGSISNTMDVCMAGNVEYFFTHILSIFNVNSPQKSKKVEHIFAKVQWFERHPHSSSFAYPLLVVSTAFESEGPASIVPLSRIICRCGISNKMSAKFDYGEDTVYFISPYFQKQVLMPMQLANVHD